MDIRKMQYFISVAETLNFSRAAKINYISQAAISQAIAGMEDELGVALFKRNTNYVELTAAGKVYLEEVKKIVSMYDYALRKTKMAERGLDGIIRIGYTGPIEMNLLIPVLEQFQNIYPAVDLNLHKQSFRVLLDELLSGVCDVIFVCGHELYDMECVEKADIYSGEIYLAVSSKHKKAHLESIDARDVAEEKIIMLSEESGPLNYKLITKFCLEDGYHPNIVEKVPSLDTLILLVELNRGVTFFPHSSILSANNKVRLIRLNNSHHSFSVAMAWNRGSKNAIIKQIAEIAKSFYLQNCLA